VTSRSTERTIAGALFIVTAAAYCLTSYPSLGVRHSGELVAVACTMGVGPAPGYGVLPLVLKTGSLIPFASDIAGRMNILSALISAGAVSLTYLITARLIRWTVKDDPHVDSHSLLVHAGALLGALSLAFSDSFWANANQAETVNPSVLLLAGMIWAFLRWQAASTDGAPLLAYLFGLSAGVEWSLMALIAPLALLSFHRRYEPTTGMMVLSILASIATFIVLSFGVTSWLPAVLAAVNPRMPAFGSLAAVFAFIVLAAIALIAVRRVPAAARRTALIAGCFAVGLSSSLVVPLRASRHPDVDRGSPISAADYRAYLADGISSPFAAGGNDGEMSAQGPRSITSLVTRFVMRAQEEFMRRFFWNVVGRSDGGEKAVPALPGIDMPESVGTVGSGSPGWPKYYYAIPLLIGFLGMFQHLRKATQSGVFLLVSFALLAMLPLVFSAHEGPGSGENAGGIAIPVAVFAVWIGIGAATVARWFRGTSGSLARASIAMGVLAVVLPVNFIRLNAADHANGTDYSVPDFAYNLLQSCDSSAVLVTEGSDDTYPLLYLQHAAGIRRDVRVVNRLLLDNGWYARQCLSTVDGGATPAVISGITAEEVEQLAVPTAYSLLRTGWSTDRKEITIPVPKNVMKAYAAQRPKAARVAPDSVMREVLPATMSYIARAEYPVALDSAGDSVRYYRPWRDVMLENIIRTAAWQRPVYVSVTCDREAISGLEDYLRLEGLAWRITPVASREEPYLLRSAVRGCLFKRSYSMARGPKRGFLFRSQFQPASSINPCVTEFVSDYRNVYLRYAEHALRYAGDRQGVVQALRSMAEVFPRGVYPMDYRYLYDIAVLFRNVGSMDTWARLRDIVVASCREEIRTRPNTGIGVSSPYRYLLDVYQQDGDFPRALTVLDELQRRAPDAVDIRAKRDELLKERQISTLP
jgi:hypothetical protein